MDQPAAPPATEDLARTPAFEEVLHELVESGFGELQEELPSVPDATPPPTAALTSWW